MKLAIAIVLAVAAMASATSSLEFQDTVGDCTITKQGATLDVATGCTLSINSRNVLDEVDDLKKDMLDVKTRLNSLEGHPALATEKEYIVAEPRGSACPSGTEPILSQSECQAAAEWFISKEKALYHDHPGTKYPANMPLATPEVSYMEDHPASIRFRFVPGCAFHVAPSNFVHKVYFNLNGATNGLATGHEGFRICAK